MRSLIVFIAGLLTGLVVMCGVYLLVVERADDFTPVYFGSEAELPATCQRTFMPILFYRRTDGRLFYCEEGVWEETE